MDEEKKKKWNIQDLNKQPTGKKKSKKRNVKPVLRKRDIKNHDEFVFHKDEFDIEDFINMYNRSERLQEKIGSKKQDRNLNIGSDIFHSLNCHYPISKKDEEIPSESTRIIKRVFDEVQKQPDFKELQAGCQGDPASAAIGTLGVAPQVMEQLGEVKELGELDEIEKKLNKINPKDFKDKKKLNKVQLRKKKQWDDLQQQHEQMKNQANQKINSNMANLRNNIKQSAKDAQQTIDSVESMGAWGNEPGAHTKMEMNEALDMARKLVDDWKLRKIAELAGRFSQIALHKKENSPNKQPEEIVDVEIGNSLHRLLAIEYIYYSEAEDWFYKNYTENRCLQWRMEGTEKKGKGPIVCCIDYSGSMSGEREVWAKAYFLALQKVAAKEKRDIYFVPFECSLGRPRLLPQGRATVAEIVSMMTEGVNGGGTNFDHPINFSVDVINDSLPKADIIFITDGECWVDDETVRKAQECKNKHNTRFYSILIDGREDSLQEITDQTIFLGKKGSEEETMDLFANF